MSDFFTILTTVGRNRLANATATGTSVNLTQFRLGDGGGSMYTPTENQTNLRREVWRGNITMSRVDPQNPNWIVVEVDVPTTDGGFMIREAGIFDSTGAMIAIARYPETYKPIVSEGSAKELKVRMIIEVSNASSVTLNINPNIITVTQRELTETLDSAGFGENNLIRNSSEPIIINPAGNLNTASHVIHNDLELATTYSYIADVKNLRGIDKATFRILGADSPDQTNNRPPVREEVLEIVDGKVSTTFTTPPVGTFPHIQICINAGAKWNETLGNTLEVRNQMLIKGDRSQPYRPAHEDNTERLDKIETLKPNVRRTVATFEGKVAGSVVENPHVAHWATASTSLLSPNSTTQEVNQININAISNISSGRSSIANAVANAPAQMRYTFNIIRHLEDNYSTAIWQGHTALADKVRIARQKCKRIACVCHVRGVTNGVPWVTLRIAASSNIWDGIFAFHTNSINQRLTHTTTNPNLLTERILDDGTVRFIVHTAEGQTTPIGGATLTTEFVQFEVDVETTLASTDWTYPKAEIDAMMLNQRLNLEQTIRTQTKIINRLCNELEIDIEEKEGE